MLPLFLAPLLIITCVECAAVRFVAIGDYGIAGPDLASVSQLVAYLQPEFLITMGDNNYYLGENSTIDQNVGQYFHNYIYPYRGNFGAGSADQINRFFPSMGNHDYGNMYPSQNMGAPYLWYFGVPRYYRFTWGGVDFFALDSDGNEPDGTSVTSKQAMWLKQELNNSRADFRVVYMHHAPYSSSEHGSTPGMQWPFAEWGASLVIAGHDHTYERLFIRNFTYIVNGLGGGRPYGFPGNVDGSVFRYSSKHGVMLGTVEQCQLRWQFWTVDHVIVDEFNMTGNSGRCGSANSGTGMSGMSGMSGTTGMFPGISASSTGSGGISNGTSDNGGNSGSTSSETESSNWWWTFTSVGLVLALFFIGLMVVGVVAMFIYRRFFPRSLASQVASRDDAESDSVALTSLNLSARPSTASSLLHEADEMGLSPSSQTHRHQRLPNTDDEFGQDIDEDIENHRDQPHLP